MSGKEYDYCQAFKEFNKSVKDFTKALEKNNTALNNIKNVLRETNVTEYKCPVCGCNLLYDYDNGEDIILYCLECEKRVKVKRE